MTTDKGAVETSVLEQKELSPRLRETNFRSQSTIALRTRKELKNTRITYIDLRMFVQDLRLYGVEQRGY
jgi:hypothetical protein